MKLKSLATLILTFILMSQTAWAQKHTLEDVGRNSLRNSGTIVKGNIIQGYFYFYFSEKVDRKTSNYQIVILDENLKEIASETVREGKRTSLLEASYNGDAILFKFFDSKAKTVFYRTMDNEGKLSGKTTREANKYELAAYSNSLAKDLKNVNVHSANDKAFIDIYTFKSKGYTYALECLNNNGEQLWTYEAPSRKGVSAAGFLASSDELILLAEGRTKNLLSRDYTFNVVGVDMDGELSFEISLENSKYTYLPHNAVFTKDGNIMLLGEYYLASDKSMKAGSKGIFVKTVDIDGEDIEDKRLSWSRDIASKVDAETKRELSKNSLYFHSIERQSDGKIIAICEQYRKQVSAAGNAMKIAAMATGGSTNASSFEIKIGNILVFTLTEEGALENVEVLKKKPNRITLAQEYSLVNQHLLAKLLAAEGAFDYQFMQTNEDNSVMTLAYTDLVKEKGKLFRSVVLNLVNFNENEAEPTTDQFTFETEANGIIIMAGKPGHVVVAEYFRKPKTIELRLEPINN